jgi:imidazolonepropionase
MKKLIGPFRQIIPLTDIPLRGALQEEQMQIIPNGGILIEGDKILEVDSFDKLAQNARTVKTEVHLLEGDFVCLPGLIDAHTHICFGGSRAMDYAARNAGKTYLEIARAGGGIWSSVSHTRAASQLELAAGVKKRAQRHLQEGVTTIEVKSGYGLNVAQELKMLRAIAEANRETQADLIPTCLATHIVPKDFDGDDRAYAEHIVRELFPLLQDEQLCQRIDIFVEETAFSKPVALDYLSEAKRQGFDLTVHADQFHTDGSAVAIAVGARSADHLEASGEAEIKALTQSEVIPVALPGASLGLGVGFAPARKLLDAGCSRAIASDWNPGSAPMGDLLMQAAVLGAYEKLNTTEVFAALTKRAAAALGLSDRGELQGGKLADFIAFPTDDYREILYQQGKLRPELVWKRGRGFKSP